jgi:hypothetical protein
MAGSFRHCDRDGAFYWGTIDNMGDAFEACHMMHWMIRHMAGGDHGKIEEASRAYFERLNEHGHDEEFWQPVVTP